MVKYSLLPVRFKFENKNGGVWLQSVDDYYSSNDESLYWSSLLIGV